MIPSELTTKAVKALIEPARTLEVVPEWRLEMYRTTVNRIIEAVAADIWDEGEKAGYIHGQHDTHRFDPGPDWHETPNPYRNEHA